MASSGGVRALHALDRMDIRMTALACRRMLAPRTTLSSVPLRPLSPIRACSCKMATRAWDFPWRPQSDGPSRQFSTSGSMQLPHRPFLRKDAERLRRVKDGSFVLPKDNPGVRIEPVFIDETFASELVLEARDACKQYGYPYDGDKRAHALAPDGSIESTAPLVNNIRVTGRLEKPSVQRLPPWGYGDQLAEESVPPAMHRLATRIRTCGAFRVGRLRDVTINHREHSFFQLDPHLDPADDGPDVFILGLLSSGDIDVKSLARMQPVANVPEVSVLRDVSDCFWALAATHSPLRGFSAMMVTTFTPVESVCTSLGLSRRRSPVEVGTRSWTDADVDALFEPRTLLHFSGDARHAWMHAIRAGVQVPQPTGDIICDWWGQTDYLLRRGQERMSIVLAFGPPEAA